MDVANKSVERCCELARLEEEDPAVWKKCCSDIRFDAGRHVPLSGMEREALDEIDTRKVQKRRLVKILDGITDFPQARISAHEREQIVDVVHVAKEILEEITDIPVEYQSIGTPVRSTKEIRAIYTDLLQERISKRTGEHVDDGPVSRVMTDVVGVMPWFPWEGVHPCTAEECMIPQERLSVRIVGADG